MDRLFGDDGIFASLLFEKKHRETCIRALELGKSISAPLVEKIIERDAALLDKIWEMNFCIYSDYNHYTDSIENDAKEVFNLCCNHYGQDKFLEIVLAHSNMYEYFLCFFAQHHIFEGSQESRLQDKKDLTRMLDFLEECLMQGRETEVCALLENSESLKYGVSTCSSESFKNALFDVVQNSYSFSDEEMLYMFGLDVCINKGMCSLNFLEHAFWCYDEDDALDDFWSIIHDNAVAEQEISKTKEPIIIRSMKFSFGS